MALAAAKAFKFNRWWTCYGFGSVGFARARNYGIGPAIQL